MAAAFQIDAEEVIDKPSYLHQSDVDRLLSHHGVASDQLNPILQCTLAILSILTVRYGDQCRIVYWLHEA